MKYLNKYLMGGISAVALACPFAAMAQTASSEGARASENDIIVTATRRDESILDVPLSVAAFSQEMLDEQGVRNIEDLARVTPGVTLGVGFSGIKYIAVRGLFSAVGATMTGVYVDETPIQVRSLSLSTNFYPAIFDLERVEVLRGPQGTLFGAGAMGGAVRFIQSKPSLTDYSGSARAELAFTDGGDPSYEAGVAAGGPIIKDKVGFRASVYHRRDGGYIDRVPFIASRGTPEKNSNSRETTVANLALTLAPTERLAITPSVFFQQANRDDTDQYLTFTSTSARPQPRRFINGEGVPSFGRDKTFLYSLKAEYDLGGASLISNTAFIDRKTRSTDDSTSYLLDILGLPFDLSIPGVFDERSTISLRLQQRAFTQELRLQSSQDSDSRLSYVLGLFYQNSRQRVTERDVATNPPYILPTDAEGLVGRAFDRSRDRQYAAFGQLDYKLADRLTLTAGVRVSRMEFDFFNNSGGTLFGVVNSTASGRTKETPVTPKFGIQYEPTANLMFYASAAKGFRSGGANPGGDQQACATDLAALGLTGTPRQYKSDSVWSYELGSKGRLGRAVTFAASIFTIDWSNIQRARSLLSCGAVYIENLGSARSRGFDAQISLNPTRGLTFDISLGYTDTTQRTTIRTPPNATRQGTLSRKGDRFSVPWNVSLSADYETSLGWGDFKGYGRVQYDFKNAYTAKPGNIGFNPLFARVDDQDFLSARMGVRNGPVDVSLFVNNLLNSRDVIGRLNFAPSERVLVQTFRPRTIGLTAGYRF